MKDTDKWFIARKAGLGMLCLHAWDYSREKLHPCEVKGTS